jgi:hypothetical protein
MVRWALAWCNCTTPLLATANFCHSECAVLICTCALALAESHSGVSGSEEPCDDAADDSAGLQPLVAVRVRMCCVCVGQDGRQCRNVFSLCKAKTVPVVGSCTAIKQAVETHVVDTWSVFEEHSCTPALLTVPCSICSSRIAPAAVEIDLLHHSQSPLADDLKNMW